MKLPTSIKFLAFGMILFITGCCSCKKTENIQAAPASQATPVQRFITVSTAGGFSGRSSGYIIMDDATVIYHSWMANQTKTEALGVIDVQVIGELRRMIAKQQLSTFHHQEIGNMTTSFDINDGELSIHLSWPGVFPNEENVPARVLPLFRRLAQILDPFLEKMGEK
jgi:hypothetical protein